MKINGVEIPKNAVIDFFGWPFGLDMKRVARLRVRSDKFQKFFHIIRVDSELEENNFSGLYCKIKLVEDQNESGVLCAIIINGEFHDQMFFFELEK